jgi:hypothetical protein
MYLRPLLAGEVWQKWTRSSLRLLAKADMSVKSERGGRFVMVERVFGMIRSHNPVLPLPMTSLHF